jgi:hypothetical protein
MKGIKIKLTYMSVANKIIGSVCITQIEPKEAHK